MRAALGGMALVAFLAGLAPAAADSPDVVFVANRDGDSVAVVDPAAMSIVETIDVGDGPTSLALTPDQRRLYVTLTFDDQIAVVSVARRSLVATVPSLSPDDDATPGVGPWDIVIGRNGRFGYVSNVFEHNIDVLRVADNTFVGTIESQEFFDTPQGMDLSPSGRFLYVGNVGFLRGFWGDVSAPPNVTIVRTRDNAVVGSVDLSEVVEVFGPWDVTALSSGSGVYANDGDDGLSVFAIDTQAGSPTRGEVVAVIPVGVELSGPRGMESGVTPLGLRVFAAVMESHEVAVIDPVSNQVVHTISTGDGTAPWRVALSPNGQQLWVSLRDADEILVLDTMSYTELGRIEGFDKPHDIVFTSRR